MFRKKLSILLLAVVMVLSISSSAFAHSVQASSNANSETPKKWASVVKRYTYGYYPTEIYYDNGFGWTGNLVAKELIVTNLVVRLLMKVSFTIITNAPFPGHLTGEFSFLP
ncbi:hypothetical protein P7H19_22225 [Paenibacillus larvae]|nr:hypothetical protein [Paenibacillus larvae]MDT2238462.1 hypothetical protein [Paenibacillus larvae]